MMKTPFEALAIREGIKPQTGGSARSGDYVSLRGYSGCMIMVQIAQGAANTTALTVDKATAVAGTNESTGITLNNWWKLEDTPTSTANYTKGASAASITTSATGSGSSVYVIDVKAEELGAAVSDGTPYDCIQLEAGSSSASNVLSATYVLYGARYAQQTPFPSITD